MYITEYIIMISTWKWATLFNIIMLASAKNVYIQIFISFIS